MKVLPWLSLVLTVLVGTDGFYMVMTHYQPKDVNNFNLSDGGTVIVAAFFLVVITVAAFVVSKRTERRQAVAEPITQSKEVQ